MKVKVEKMSKLHIVIEGDNEKTISKMLVVNRPKKRPASVVLAGPNVATVID